MFTLQELVTLLIQLENCICYFQFSLFMLINISIMPPLCWFISLCQKSNASTCFINVFYNAYLLLEFQILLATLMHGGQHEAKGLVKIIALKMLKWIYICIIYLLHQWWLVSFLASGHPIIQQMAIISMFIWLNLAKWMMNYISIWFKHCNKLKPLGLNDSKFSTFFQMYV